MTLIFLLATFSTASGAVPSVCNTCHGNENCHVALWPVPCFLSWREASCASASGTWCSRNGDSNVDTTITSTTKPDDNDNTGSGGGDTFKQNQSCEGEWRAETSWNNYDATDGKWCLSKCQETANKLETDGCCLMDYPVQCAFYAGEEMKEVQTDIYRALEIQAAGSGSDMGGMDASGSDMGDMSASGSDMGSMPASGSNMGDDPLTARQIIDASCPEDTSFSFGLWYPNEVVMEMTQLAENVYATTHGSNGGTPGTGTSGGFIVLEDGIFMMESYVHLNVLCQVLALIDSVAPELPILYVSNTNNHGDHSFGNRFLKGTTKIMHHHAKELMESIACKEESNFLGGMGLVHADIGVEFKCETEPSMTFGSDHDEQEMTMDEVTLSGRKFQFLDFGYFMQTHGDLLTFDVKSRTLWTGNMVLGNNPGIVWQLDGGVAAAIPSYEALVAWCDNLNKDGNGEVTIVPGHNPPTDCSAASWLLEYLTTLKGVAEAAKINGDSYEQYNQNSQNPKAEAYPAYEFAHNYVNAPTAWIDFVGPLPAGAPCAYPCKIPFKGNTDCDVCAEGLECGGENMVCVEKATESTDEPRSTDDPNPTDEPRSTADPNPTDEPRTDYYKSGEPCPESDFITEAPECEMAAEALGLSYVSKTEQKEAPAGCFSGFGVFFNSHSEAPEASDKYEYVCKYAPPETDRPTEAPSMGAPECEAACQSDLDRTDREVVDLKTEVDYLMKDLPTVLANTFSTVNDLEKLVKSLQEEVEKLKGMVEDHDNRFSCLAGMSGDSKPKPSAF